MIVSMWSLTVFASDGETVQPAMYATFWALVPPIVAIGLALITKEVYSSLFIGIVVGVCSPPISTLKALSIPC